jgi:hypothetical protein
MKGQCRTKTNRPDRHAKITPFIQMTKPSTSLPTLRTAFLTVATALAWLAFDISYLSAEETAQRPFGTQGMVGHGMTATTLDQLVITKAGVYENFLIDGQWAPTTLVKITADNVILRNCEIRHTTKNAIVVAGKNIVIESCRIHHALAGAFTEQADAHGITGSPENLVVRNCDIGLVSGDAIQFDPGRRPWDNVLVEHCTLWTGPLPADAAGFKRGERPGENAIDTKQLATNPRSRLTLRHCLLYGWNQPGQIGNIAALNLKNNVAVTVEHCLLYDNEIAFRLRGGEGEYGGALVTINDCAVYDSSVAIRAEDKIRDLKIHRLGIGSGVKSKIVSSGGGPGPGYENTGEFQPPALEPAIRNGFTRP